MKTQTVIVKYGVADNLIGNRYGMRVDGHRVGLSTTYKKRETALAKALEFAHAVHQNHFDSFYDTQFNFVFESEEVK